MRQRGRGSLQEEQGEAGLGLFIVRQTVRRMDGTIRVRSSAEGTAFTIDLPPAG